MGMIVTGAMTATKEAGVSAETIAAMAVAAGMVTGMNGGTEYSGAGVWS